MDPKPRFMPITQVRGPADTKAAGAANSAQYSGLKKPGSWVASTSAKNTAKHTMHFTTSFFVQL